MLCSAVGTDLEAIELSGQGRMSPSTEVVALGKQIFRQGRLNDGVPVEAYVKGDMKVLGTQFTCLDCHGRSGMGGAEGRTFTPAVNPAALFMPAKECI